MLKQIELVLLILMVHGLTREANGAECPAVFFQTSGVIESFKHVGELLFPYDKELVKRTGVSELKSTGKIMAEFASLNPPNYNKWIFDCRPNKPDICKIFNTGSDGYLNAYDNTRADGSRRDVFVGNERRDDWQIIKHPTTKNAFALKNLPTGEVMYAITGARGAQPGLNYFTGQTTRSVFLWKYANLNEILADPHAFWYFKACSI